MLLIRFLPSGVGSAGVDRGRRGSGVVDGLSKMWRDKAAVGKLLFEQTA